MVLFCPVVLGVTEAYHQCYSSFLQPGEASWSFGQIFSFIMLLLPIQELLTNANQPCGDTGLSKFGRWLQDETKGWKGSVQVATLRLGLPFYLFKQLYVLFGFKWDQVLHMHRRVWKEYKDERRRMQEKTQRTPGERRRGMEMARTEPGSSRNIRGLLS